MRTAKEIREEMKKLNALRPQYCKTAKDWAKVVKHNELYAEWIEAIRNEDDEEESSNGDL